MSVQSAEGLSFPITVPVAIIGAGACGQIAALACHDAEVQTVVLERDAVPQGSTALSSGMIPACNTEAQADLGIEDNVELFAADIMKKARGATDPEMVEVICRQSGTTIDWLRAHHGIELSVVQGFLYPGHSTYRMHAPATRTGAELMGALSEATARAGIDILVDAHVETLFVDEESCIRGIGFNRPDGLEERIGCQALILACNGYGGNPELVRELIPGMAEANYFGHTGNQGEAIMWGRDLGADMADLGGFQGHGSVAHPHGILISWALMMEGGIQVNELGRRFSNEHDGYSEQGRRVMAQPNGIAFDIYDQRLHELGLEFEDYREAERAGAIRQAASAVELAAMCGLPVEDLCETLDACCSFRAGRASDPFGRDFSAKPELAPPFYAIRVTGALFHTQGGLRVDRHARVCRPDGQPLPNLFAGGGAARGLSGPSDWGYLSGNGLLTAATLGHIAGTSAASLVAGN